MRMTVGTCGGLRCTSMLTGLCGGHVGVVWWVWFGRTVRIRAYVHTFVHTVYAIEWV